LNIETHCQHRALWKNIFFYGIVVVYIIIVIPHKGYRYKENKLYFNAFQSVGDDMVHQLNASGRPKPLDFSECYFIPSCRALAD
jgi:hypothetical protein